MYDTWAGALSKADEGMLSVFERKIAKLQKVWRIGQNSELVTFITTAK